MKILIIGGGMGGTILANNLARRLSAELRAGKARITMLSASDRHLYQPALLYLALGRTTPDALYRDQASLLEPGIEFHVDPAEEFQLDNNRVKAKSGKTYDYDVLVIDAFTGDGVPSHLLTREALAIYIRRLATKDGILLIHASSRYSNFYPVVEETARSQGLAAIAVHTEIKKDVTEPGKERDWDPTPTDYIIITKPGQTKDVAAWFPDEEDGGRVKHTVNSVTSPLVHSQLIWSDDRNAAIDVLELGRFLTD